MHPIEMNEKIYLLTNNITDPDYLFEGLWHIPDGVSINSYLINGEKKALIDLTQDLENFPGELMAGLKSLGIEADGLDYLVINHMEPDHSGALGWFKENFPRAEILCSKKTTPLLKAFAGIEKGIREVSTGDSVDLGNISLNFYDAPNVHWPETMVTFEPVSGTLFSCDAFGSYGAVDLELAFDDLLCEERHSFYEAEALRYYANIVSSFSAFVEKAVEKISGLDIKVIAPAHGIIWRQDVKTIIERYLKYAGYMKKAEPEITLVYGSMYGNTKKMADSVLKGIESIGIKVHVHNVPKESVGLILSDLWKSAGIVLGMPTYEYKMFPPMKYLIDVMNIKRIRNREVFRFGSFGWSGGAEKEMEALTEKSGWNLTGSLEWQGSPSDTNLTEGYAAGVKFAQMILDNY